MMKLPVLFTMLVAACGCASAPVAFSANTVESPIADNALQLRFQVVNRDKTPRAISIGAESIHIESVTRDGKPVTPEDTEAKLLDDPRKLLRETLPIVEPDGLVAFFLQSGLSDLSLVGETWHRRVFPLTHGKYRVVFAYRYDGPDDGKPSVFRGRLVARVTFKVD